VLESKATWSGSWATMATGGGASGEVIVNSLANNTGIRFVRYRQTAAPAEPILNAFECDGTPGTSLVVPISSATASSTNGGNVAANAIDGNLGTRWANNSAMPTTFTIEFDNGNVVSFDQLAVHPEDA